MFSVDKYVTEYIQLLSHIDPADIEQLSQHLLNAWRNNRTVFCCGNGGSAANASHFATDLSKLTAPARGRRLRAAALTESASALSAIANDISYDDVFVEQLKTFAAPNDVLVAFSTSGRSPNVLRAVQHANAIGALTVAVTGQEGEMLRRLARHTVTIESTSVQQVEEATLMIGHLLCLRTRELVAHESIAVPFRQRVAELRDVRSAGRSAM